jgi:hypothetical protein
VGALVAPILGVGDTIEIGNFRLFTGAAHYFVCHEHKVQWRAGFNPFSTLRDETVAERERQAMIHSQYQVVEAYYPTDEEQCSPVSSGDWLPPVSPN